MKVYVRGPNSKVTAEEYKYATEWMSALLMSTQLCNNLKITIAAEEEKGLRGSAEPVMDEYAIEGSWLPRTFRICINPNLSRRTQLLTLAHELVHVKQYAKGELKDTRYPDVTKWNKQLISDCDTEYWDLPWEIEANGREYGMYRRYCDHLLESKTKF